MVERSLGVMFFGGEYDFREVEAEMLNYRIRNCILDNNVDDLLSGEGVGGFFEFCGLNKEVVEKWNIIKICENAEDCINSDGKLISGGENDFQQCGFKGSEKNLNLYRCSTSRIDKGEKQIEVIVGSKQRLRRGNE
jgi:hypothetical protein